MKLTDKEIIITIVALIVGIVGVACMSYGLSVYTIDKYPQEMFPGYETPTNTSAAYQILVNALPVETPVEPETAEVQLPEPDYCWGGSSTPVEETDTEEPVEVYNPHKAQWNNIQNNVYNGQSMNWY